jgi:tRNA threonylcarbamoyladenosine biosynthesis protein TsaE
MTTSTLTFYCHNQAETESLAFHVGCAAWAGLNLTITGPLGAGKTVFARGLARGLGITDTITSPSYPIIQEYSGRLPFYHMDWYRLRTEDEVLETGAAELLGEAGVCLVEWPDRALELFDESTIRIEIQILSGESRRIDIRQTRGNQPALAWPENLPDELKMLLKPRHTTEKPQGDVNEHPGD